MQDISLHLLDIIENSVRAKARNIWISIRIEVFRNKLELMILDDGSGMDAETLENAQNPFYTTKLEREKKVGLGIPLFKQNAEMCNGSFFMKSEPGVGTELKAIFELSHVDRMPLGKIGDTMLGCIIGHPEADFHLKLERLMISGEVHEFEFSTAEVKKELGDIPITYPDVIMYVDSAINEGIKNTKMEEI